MKGDLLTLNPAYKSVLLGLLGIFSLAIVWVCVLAIFDYSHYRDDFEYLEQSERKKVSTELSEMKESANELSHLIKSRIEAAEGKPERIQNILSSTGQLAAQLELPVILRARYEMFSETALEITRFGIKSLQRKPAADEPYDKAVVLDKGGFSAEQRVLGGNSEVLGILTLNFEMPKIGKYLQALSKTPTNPTSEQINLEGLIFYVNPPLTFWQSTWVNALRYAGFWAFTLLMMIAMGMLYFYLRRQFESQYGEQIKRLKKDISGLVNSEFSHQSYRTESKELQRIQALLSQQQKEQIEHLHIFLSHFIDSYKNSESSFSEEEIHILNSGLVSLEALSLGLCSPLHKTDISMLEIIEPVSDLFASRIHSNEITFEIDCSKDLSIQGDRTFLYLILLNIIGRSLYRVYKMGHVDVQVTSQKKVLEIIVSDSGEAPSHTIEQMIDESFPLFIESRKLEELCRKSGIVLKRERKPKQNVITIIIPIPSTESESDNVVSLFQ